MKKLKIKITKRYKQLGFGITVGWIGVNNDYKFLGIDILMWNILFSIENL